MSLNFKKLGRKVIAPLLLALIAPLFLLISPSPARADFYTSIPTSLPTDNNYLNTSQSDAGDVILTADGCLGCELLKNNGAAYLSTDGGANFTILTSVGTENWLGAQVSADGKRMVLFTSTNFFISTDKGVTFTRVDAIPFSMITENNLIQCGTISSDGSSIFFGTRRGYFGKYTYSTASRRWVSSLLIHPTLHDYRAMTSNADGSKVYISTQYAGLFKYFGTTFSPIANTTVGQDGYALHWSQVRTSDSGIQVMALAYSLTTGGVAYKSTDSGSTFTAITSVNGVALDVATSVEVSGDGAASFFGTSYYDLYGGHATLYTQHGAGSSWFSREILYGSWIYDSLASNGDGSMLVVNSNYWPLRIINGKPSAPILTRVAMASASSIAVDWGFEVQPGGDSTQTNLDTTLEYSTSSSGPWTVVNDGVIGGDSGTITVSGLTPQQIYYFRAKARNVYGTSLYSATSNGMIYGKPTTPAAPVRIANSGLNEIYLSFQTPSDLGGASSVAATEWQFSTDGGTNWNASSSATFTISSSSITNLQGTFSATVISEFTPGAPMTVRSRSSNGALWSDWSPSATFSIYKRPAAVTNLQVTPSTTSAVLTWDAPSDLGGATLVEYEYGYKLSSGASWTLARTTNRSVTISGLLSNTAYDYVVRPITNIGLNAYDTYFYNGQTLNPPTKLVMNRNSSGAQSRKAFTTQPKISFYASNNSLVTSESNAIVYAEVNKGGIIVGRESATAVSGVATFSDLGLRGVAGTQYQVTYRSGNLTPVSETLTLLAGDKASLNVLRKSVGGTSNVIFTTQPQFEFIDADGNRLIADETSTVTLTTNQGYLWDGLNSSPVQRAHLGLVTFSDVRIAGSNGSTAILTYASTGLTSYQETITITTGPATTFTRTTRAADGYIGSKFGVQPVYQIIDSAGNVVTTGEYSVTISASQGTLIGKKTATSVNGVIRFTDLGISGVSAGQLVILSVASQGFTTYTGDSIVTVKGHPVLNWSDFYIPRTTGTFSIPAPDSNTAGTFSYSSSNTGVITISGGTATVVSSGTSTITATFTPANSNDYYANETVTSLFTVNPGAGTLVISVSGGSAVSKGVNANISATSSDNGTVTFYANGRKIAGCISVRTQTLSATCAWKPTIQGSALITALLAPTSSAINPVNSNQLNLTISRRTGRR